MKKNVFLVNRRSKEFFLIMMFLLEQILRDEYDAVALNVF